MAHAAVNGAGPPELVRQIRRELAWQGFLTRIDDTLTTVHGYVGTFVRIGLFVGLLVCNGMVLLVKPEERATVRNMHLAFLGTIFFVMLLCSSIDGCFVDCCGGKEWIRPFRGALFAPNYFCLVLLLSPSADQYFGDFDMKDPHPEGVLRDLICELVADAGLAWFCQYISNILLPEMPPKQCPIMASSAGYVLPLTLWVTQPNLRMRIEYLSSFLGYVDSV